MATIPRLLRRPDVEALTGLSKSSIYARIGKGDFPAPVKLGYRTALWPESAVVDWINQQISGNCKSHG
jgi:prophage regulatory protein